MNKLEILIEYVLQGEILQLVSYSLLTMLPGAIGTWSIGDQVGQVTQGFSN